MYVQWNQCGFVTYEIVPVCLSVDPLGPWRHNFWYFGWMLVSLTLKPRCRSEMRKSIWCPDWCVGIDATSCSPPPVHCPAMCICLATYFEILRPASLSAHRATLPEEELACDSSRQVSTFTDFQGWDGQPPRPRWRERVWATPATAGGSHTPTGWTRKGRKLQACGYCGVLTLCKSFWSASVHTAHFNNKYSVSFVCLRSIRL